jgi:5,10-methylene-tetrahydrofolate dehydrogenase/Methenyl tetrahydrofolate cyclohydrolase
MDLTGMPVVNAMLAKFPKCDIAPKLAVIRVGENADDLAYERGIIKRFGTAGADVDVNVLPSDCEQNELNELMIKLNGDETVHGILLFRPLPPHLSEDTLKTIISPKKDVDCFGIVNNAAVYYGDSGGYPPCTPQAVIEMLDHYGIDVTGKKVTVVGRSMVVGKPLAMLLIQRSATVTVCHTRTADLESECRAADILIACAGKAKMINENHVCAGQIVIDVGINMLDGKLCGDVDYEKVKDIAAMITPVPGGVGTVTTSVLLKHTIESATGD